MSLNLGIEQKYDGLYGGGKRERGEEEEEEERKMMNESGITQISQVYSAQGARGQLTGPQIQPRGRFQVWFSDKPG